MRQVIRRMLRALLLKSLPIVFLRPKFSQGKCLDFGSVAIPKTPALCCTREPAFSQCLLLLFQAGILRVGVDNAAGNDRKYGADVLDRVVRHGEVVVA